MFVIYNKTTGKILQTITGTFNPRYLPQQDGFIEVQERDEAGNPIKIDPATQYIENGELKTAENRPSMQHVFDVVTKEWVRVGAEPDNAAVAKNKRDALLAETDWVVTKALETGNPVPQVWIDYRQALRDITAQPDFPNNIVWPEKPV